MPLRERAQAQDLLRGDVVSGELIVLRCVAVADLRVPQPGSTVDACRRCYENVWVGPGVLEHLEAAHGTSAVVLCVACAHAAEEGAEEVEHVILPRDIDALLEDCAPAEAAAIIAASSVTTPGPGMGRLLVALVEEPDGELAQRYVSSYMGAKLLVSNYRRRN